MDKTYDKRKKVVYDLICDELYVPMKFKEIAMLLQVSKEQRSGPPVSCCCGLGY